MIKEIDMSWYEEAQGTKYYISNVKQLFTLALIVNGTPNLPQDSFQEKTIILSSDIDMSDVKDCWVPIGTQQYPFKGVFKGNSAPNKRKITNFNMSVTDRPCIALFGVTSEDARLLNFRLDCQIKGTRLVAGVVAMNGGDIHSVIVSGKIEGKGQVGGLAATSTGVIVRCNNQANITGEQYVGGIVGYNQNDIGEITDCFNSGTICGRSNIAGIAGFNNGTIRGSINSGIITVPTDVPDNTIECIAGIVGTNSAGCSIENCINKGAVCLSLKERRESGEYYTYLRGAKVGGITGSHLGTMVNCANEAEIEGATMVGGISGELHNGRIKLCLNIANVTGKQTVGGVAGIILAGCVGSCFNNGAVLAYFGYVGGICGNEKWGEITTSVNNGQVSTKNESCCAGIVGCVVYGALSGNSNIGVVKDIERVGGICGSCSQKTSVEKCTNTGYVYGNKVVGGLMGFLDGDVSRCKSTGNVSGIEEYATVVGVKSGGTIQDCYSVGKVQDAR